LLKTSKFVDLLGDNESTVPQKVGTQVRGACLPGIENYYKQEREDYFVEIPRLKTKTNE
jgi:hypothetical protein